MIHILPNTYVKPLALGDKVFTAAISSYIDEKTFLMDGIKIFQDWGLDCKIPKTLKNQWGYLAGKDEDRYKELYPKQEQHLIAFVKGGWGAARLLEKEQLWTKGWVLGFSDLTSILLARLSAGFDGCIHGPLINTLSNEPSWSKERLRSILFGDPIPDIYGKKLKGGLANGPIVVANLTVASHLIGSSHFPSLKGAILILEDIGESPYRIDRMLTQWRLSGILKDLAGLGFGNFKDCEEPEERSPSKTFQLKEVLIERTKDLKIPIVTDLPIGHCIGNAALPLGKESILNGDNGCLSVISV